ncbi:MAG: pilus assembly protein PilP [Desulfobacterales bacterium]|nr:pilus assembly protein PilP [Desulfobacterales bacterium]
MCGKQEKKKSSFLMNPVTRALLLVLFMVQASYADSALIYKKPRPEKAPADIERKVRPEKVLGETGKDVRPEKIPEKKKTDVASEKKPPEPGKKAEYVYNRHGKTDPFVPFVNAPETSITKYKGPGGEKAAALLNKLKEPKTELQTIELSQFTLTAIIKSEDKTWAMVSDPEGRGYMLKEGTYIGTGGGVVDKVICKEKMTPFGIEPVRKIIIKEPYVNSEGSLAYKSIEKKIMFSTGD